MHGPVIRRGRLGVRSGEQRGRAEEQMQYLGGGLSSPVARSPPSKNSSTQNRGELYSFDIPGTNYRPLFIDQRATKTS
jgi:hypothetical protein